MLLRVAASQKTDAVNKELHLYRLNDYFPKASILNIRLGIAITFDYKQKANLTGT